MADVIELAKIVGSISGICSAVFLIADRYFKHYPTAIVTAQPLTEHSVNISHYLRVKNYSDRPIIVRWRNRETHSTPLALSVDDSTRAIVHATIPGETTISLGESAEILLRLIKLESFEDIEPDNTLELKLYWRFAQPKLWRSDRPIKVSLLKRDFDAMAESYIEAEEADSDR